MLGLDNLLTLKVTPDLFDTLLNTSAFSEFEYETCQLQLISLDGLNVNELTVFFGNIFNTLILHAIIINAKKGMYQKFLT